MYVRLYACFKYIALFFFGSRQDIGKNIPLFQFLNITQFQFNSFGTLDNFRQGNKQGGQQAQ